MPKRQIFEQEQATRVAPRKQGPEQNQDNIKHSEFSLEQSFQEINDSDGLRGFSHPTGGLGRTTEFFGYAARGRQSFLAA